MDEYLPPVVTRLKGDWSDLRAAFAESLAAAKAWSASMRAEVVNGLRGAGHEGGLAFADALKATAAKELLDGFDDDIGRNLANQGRKAGQKAGESTAMGLLETFKGMFMPGIIAVLVALTPMIGTAIAAAITLGVGLGFIGIAALAQKSNPALVKAATGFKDTVVAAFKDATSPMVGPMVSALGILATGIKQMAPAFKEIFGAISRSVPNLAHGLIEMIQAMLPGLKELAPVAGALISAFATALPDIGAGIGGLLSELAKPETAAAMITFIEDFGEVLGDVLPKVGALLSGLSQLYMLFEHGALKPLGLFGMVENLVEAWPKVVAGAKLAWEWIKKIAAAVGEWVSDKASDVADWWNGMVEAVKTKGGEVLDWFQALPGRVGDWLATLPGKLRDAAVAAFDLFFFTLGFVGAKVFTFFRDLPATIVRLSLELWDKVKQTWNTGVDTTVETAQTLPGRVMTFVVELTDKVIDKARELHNGLVEWARKAIDGTVGFFRELPGRVIAFTVEMVERVKKWSLDAGKWLYQAGKDMLQGLVNGAINATEGAIAAIRRAIQRIIDGAKRALGIASPSTVFAEMGKFSMLGFIGGLQGEQGALARAWTGLAPNTPVVGAAPSPAAALASARSGDDRPVLIQLMLDGAVLVEQLVTPAQQRKLRTGTTGLA